MPLCRRPAHLSVLFFCRNCSKEGEQERPMKTAPRIALRRLSITAISFTPAASI
jgi:hypothetical protein